MIYTAVIASALLAFVAASPQHAHHLEHHDEQIPLGYVGMPHEMKYSFGGEEVTADSIFSGITTFARLPYARCLYDKSVDFDIAFLGAPFDTGTSYRPGARFGPSGIRAGSRRLNLYGWYNVPLGVDITKMVKMIDCGDVPVTSFDNAVAIKQIEQGHKELLHRKPHTPLPNGMKSVAKDGKEHPRIITLGGDHTIVLPLLRSVASAYGSVSVLHFDSHLDTWKPKVFGGAPSDQAAINHGTYFWHASEEGLINNGTSVHGAIRTTLSSLDDYDNDDNIGFHRIEAREIDVIGVDGIIKRIKKLMGDNPIYLSIDIDSLDPAFAPATGTPETGGWSTRELRAIIRGLAGMKIISADIVEVAPAYDTNAEVTALAAADLLLEVAGIMALTPMGK